MSVVVAMVAVLVCVMWGHVRRHRCLASNDVWRRLP